MNVDLSHFEINYNFILYIIIVHILAILQF